MKRFILIFMVVAIVCSFFLLACPASAAGTGEHAISGAITVHGRPHSLDIDFSGFTVLSYWRSSTYDMFTVFVSSQPFSFSLSADGTFYDVSSSGELTCYFFKHTCISGRSVRTSDFSVSSSSYKIYLDDSHSYLSLDTDLPDNVNLLGFKVDLPCSPDDILVVLDSLRGQISVSTVVSALAFVAGVSVGLVFMWWGLRKAADALMRAFKRGKVDL